MPNWDLTFFYSSEKDEKIKKDLEEFINGCKNLREDYYDALADKNLSPEKLRKFFEDSEDVEKKGYYAAQYAHLNYARNTMNQEAQKLMSMVEDYETNASIITSFWKPRLLKLSESKLIDLRDSDELKEYKHVMEKLIESKEHVLSEEAEKVISALSSSSREAFAELYERQTSSYEFEIIIDGQVKTLTGPQVRALRHDTDSDLRKRAMKKFFKRYEEDKIILEKSYNSIVKHYDTESRLRNFERPISMRNLDNEVEDDIIDTVIKVTTERTPLVHKYYKFKEKYLGEKLTLADIYAPLNPVKKEYSFDQAKEIVLDAYYEFDKEIGDIVKSFFDENRIDSEIRKGKRGGAFCSYAFPNYKPFVLLNYNGNMGDVMTLAHELGHGVHGTLSSEQNIWNYHTPLTMAEVASVFGEMLVMDKVLPTLNEEDKKAFIASKTEEMFATMFRQNMFARFEVQSHDMIADKGVATWEELSELYNKELKIMFGDSVEIPEEYNYEWAGIPHIFSVPFYVYAYNFANLLVIALYEMYKEEGKDFIPKYKKLLRSGGNKRPEELLEEVGINIKEESFWGKGFDYLEREFLNKLI
jgi:oligoendopeptidase F